MWHVGVTECRITWSRCLFSVGLWYLESVHACTGTMHFVLKFAWWDHASIWTVPWKFAKLPPARMPFWRRWLMINYECRFAWPNNSRWWRVVVISKRGTHDISICIINYLHVMQDHDQWIAVDRQIESSVRPRIPRGMTRVKSRTHTSDNQVKSQLKSWKSIAEITVFSPQY